MHCMQYILRVLGFSSLSEPSLRKTMMTLAFADILFGDPEESVVYYDLTYVTIKTMTLAGALFLTLFSVVDLCLFRFQCRVDTEK